VFVTDARWCNPMLREGFKEAAFVAIRDRTKADLNSLESVHFASLSTQPGAARQDWASEGNGARGNHAQHSLYSLAGFCARDVGDVCGGAGADRDIN
jgi:hypothetical protein